MYEGRVNGMRRTESPRKSQLDAVVEIQKKKNR